MKESTREAPPAVDEDDYDGTLGDRDLILSREDFAMLHVQYSRRLVVKRRERGEGLRSRLTRHALSLSPTLCGALGGLQALHRFVPLPALSSNILRILCDDDLQVPVDDNDNDSDNGSAGACQSEHRIVAVRRGSNRSLLRSAGVAASVPKHSPLTRRLSKHKPHVAINLSAVSPQSRPQQQLDRVVSRKSSSNNDNNSSQEDNREGRVE